MKQYWKTDWFIGLVVMLLFILAALTSTSRDLELAGYDLGVRFSSTKPANQDVVIIAIDDAAIQEKGAWPWPRDMLADATLKLAAARPAVIGYVLPFDSQQSVHGLEYIEELRKLVEQDSRLNNSRFNRLLRSAEISMDTDNVFADSLRRAGRVVLSIPYISESKVDPQSQVLEDYITKYTLRELTGIPKTNSGWQSWFSPELVPTADKVYPPIEQLAQHAGGAGTIYLGVDALHVRSEPLVLQYGDQYLPSFVLMMAARNSGLATRSIEVDLKKHQIKLGSDSINVDNKLRIYPKFYRGKKDNAAFPVYSILDIIEGKLNRNLLHDKTVLIGLTAPQHAIPQKTPIGENMPPVLVTAHKVSSLLNDELYTVPEWAHYLQIVVIVLIGFYLMYVLPRFRFSTGWVLSLLVLIALINAQFISMIAKSVWIPMITPMVTLLIGHLILGAKHFVEGRLYVIQAELSQANQALGQSFHSAGQLDQAFEKYRRCIVDNSLLNQLYNLGLDYERKRQFNKAVTVFQYLSEHNAQFRDVTERLSRNKEVSEAIVLGSGAASGANGTLVISSPGMQKPMLGRYQIDKELGRGAMGMVYLGHDPKIGRTVAIKTLMLSQEFQDEKLDEVKKRFFREAETAGRLNHPNIVTVYDVGEDQEMSYIAMDYLKGKSLLEYTKQGQLLSVDEVFDVIVKVADALDYAHEQRVVHRDIKPANIMYDQETGTIKVTDFGVACLTDTSKTKTGTILGSPSYMSPEQLAGKKVDGRSDLFSLGVTLYQLLAGELPFIGESLASLMYKIANEKHPDIRMFRPDLPPCAAKIVNKALHKEIERRFQNGAQFANALRRCKTRLDEE